MPGTMHWLVCCYECCSSNLKVVTTTPAMIAGVSFFDRSEACEESFAKFFFKEHYSRSLTCGENREGVVGRSIEGGEFFRCVKCA